MLKQVHHVGFAVWNLEKIINLMEEYYQLKVSKRIEIKDRQMEAVLFQTGSEILEYLAPTSENSSLNKFLIKNGEGFHHIAYLVDSIQETRDYLPHGSLLESRKSDVGDWMIADFKNSNDSGFVNQIIELI